MTRALYVIGAPGTGKTTLVAEWTRRYRPLPATRLHKQLWAEPLTLAGRLIGYRLGKTRGTFSGTDALGMAVNPDATEWALTADLPLIIVGEGQRLANLKFLTALHSRTDLTVAYLTCSVADQRRAQRAQQTGVLQDDTWVTAATTRARNLAANLLGQGITVTTIDTTHTNPTDAARLLTHAAKESTP